MASRLFLTRNPSARASAHRAMARAALFSDSSARVRLRRYNRHMDKARAFEAAARGEGLTFDSFTMGGILEALRITTSHLDSIGHRIEKATRQGGAQ